MKGGQQCCLLTRKLLIVLRGLLLIRCPMFHSSFLVSLSHDLHELLTARKLAFSFVGFWFACWVWFLFCLVCWSLSGSVSFMAGNSLIRSTRLTCAISAHMASPLVQKKAGDSAFRWGNLRGGAQWSPPARVIGQEGQKILWLLNLWE